LFDLYTINPQWVWNIKLGDYWVTFVLDGISYFFIYLTTLLVPLCLVFGWNNKIESSMSLLSIELLLILSFLVWDILFFYVFFELILVPFFLFIGILGYRKRRIHAAYLLFFYTVFGSLFLLLTLIGLWLSCGTTDLLLLRSMNWNGFEQSILWWCMFLSFAVKVPMFPLHLWLPEAHVEAPTEGSVLLAGVLLKLGTYGFIRFLFSLFPESTIYFSPLVLGIASCGVIYSSLVTLRQIDIKKIIAYSSVSHMNMCLVGLFSGDTMGIFGSFLVMIGHGIVSSALFFCIGVYYIRTHTKLLFYYSGLVYTMPLGTMFWFLFVLGNLSMPGTSNFIGEFLLMAGMSYSKQWLGVFALVCGIFFGTIYNMWLFNKMSFGIPYYSLMNSTSDVTLKEFVILVILVIYMMWMGIYPRAWMDVSYYVLIDGCTFS
jgi:proton-translocating NADH-quinone oxidoreductase chain M